MTINNASIGAYRAHTVGIMAAVQSLSNEAMNSLDVAAEPAILTSEKFDNLTVHMCRIAAPHFLTQSRPGQQAATATGVRTQKRIDILLEKLSLFRNNTFAAG
ncbi:hypothetical protein [Burkholderia sp. 8Y]|uniref:hypothetical protein n=1 Tax=Burkholderia sp. 8Y TaxID=2653133 RepID=UPI00135A1CF3|nr:hypothetical protein [Burkholderia sp. 8Y]